MKRNLDSLYQLLRKFVSESYYFLLGKCLATFLLGVDTEPAEPIGPRYPSAYSRYYGVPPKSSL